jgi:hypothetical protein
VSPEELFGHITHLAESTADISPCHSLVFRALIEVMKPDGDEECSRLATCDLYNAVIAHSKRASAMRALMADARSNSHAMHEEMSRLMSMGVESGGYLPARVKDGRALLHVTWLEKDGTPMVSPPGRHAPSVTESSGNRADRRRDLRRSRR